MKNMTRLYNKIPIITLAILSIAFVIIGISKHRYNWDIIAYVASVVSITEENSEKIHKETWDTLKEYVPTKKLENLKGGNTIDVTEYKKSMFDNPDNLISMLPMYKVKIGYIFTIKLLSFFTNHIYSVIIINILSGIFILILFYKYNSRNNYFWFIPLVLFNIFSLIKYSTPDILCTSLYVAGIYYLTKEKPKLAIFALILGLSVRPDNIIFNCILSLIMIHKYHRFSMVFLLSSVTIYFATSIYSSHIGWWPHFYFTLIEIQNNLIGFNPEFDISLYYKTLQNGSIEILSHSWFWIFYIMSIWTIYAYKNNKPLEFYIAVAAFISFIFRIVIFPVDFGIIYSVHFFVIGLLWPRALYSFYLSFITRVRLSEKIT